MIHNAFIAVKKLYKMYMQGHIKYKYIDYGTLICGVATAIMKSIFIR